jgi:hypothetical protein
LGLRRAADASLGLSEGELTAPDGGTLDGFGTSVALSGTMALIGAPYRPNDNNTGVVYVFGDSGGVWSEQAELTASDATQGDQFGYSVALSGTTALIGAPGRENGTGAAYVFAQSGGGWSQQAEVTAADAAAGDQFGSSVALSGTTALIGAPQRSTITGTAYVFGDSAGGWTQQAELTASDGMAGDGFGYSVALSGTTALIGAPAAWNHEASGGTAYVFAPSSAGWSQQAELTASDGATFSRFGWSVALSGTTALIGTPNRNSGTGGAYVFEGSGGTWSQQATLTGSDSVAGSGPGATGDGFGFSVAVSGATALIGAVYHDNYQGGAYVFGEAGGAWSQQAELAPSDNPSGGAAFGASVALSETAALIGAPGHDNGTGAAYVFSDTSAQGPPNSPGPASAPSSSAGTGAVTSLPPSGSTGSSAARVKAALSSLLKPSGKTARIKAILKAGGYSFAFAAPTPGRLVADWYMTHDHKRVLIARANTRLRSANRGTVTVKLTREGRKLLKQLRSAKITITATFTPTGTVATSRTGTAALKR